MPSVQTTVQSIQASGSEYKAKASLYIQAPLWIIMDGLFVLTGLTIYSYYEAVGCTEGTMVRLTALKETDNRA